MPVVFQISIEVNVNSVGKIAEQIGEAAMNRGWESYITCCRNGCRPSKSKTIKIGNWLDVYWHGIMTRLFDSHCLHSTRATKKLIKQIESINPDVIHLHHIHGYILNMKVLFDYLNNSNKPVVWTFHDCWSFTGHCAHFVTANCYRWKEESCHNCPLRSEYPQSLFFDRSPKNYNQKKQLFNSIKDLHLVAVSKWLAEQVSMSYFKDRPVSIIYNGIDLNKFYPSKNTSLLKKRYNLDGYFLAVGVASSWTPKKGVSDYYELSKRLPEDCSIIMIGLTKSQMTDLPPNIIGVEKLMRIDEMRDAYSIADVVLNLSYEESFGLTTVEGFACGTPSIVYDKTASPELVSEKTGYVFTAGDLKSVCNKMMEIRDKGKASYSNACINRAKEYFDKDKNYMKYLELYDNLLTKQGTAETVCGGIKCSPLVSACHLIRRAA